MRRAAVLLVLAAWVVPPPRLLAQCPDGTPPPCGAVRAAAREAPRAPDPNRVAVLPFRVTTADSLLGEGLAELVATEFSGESGPRAVHMGSVLRAWRRAGGGLRAPLSQSDGIRVAREVGAGLLVEGSVVGLGPRLRITASLVSAQDGVGRSVEPVSGAVDSLESLVRRLTSGLLGLAGGRAGAGREGRLTDSPPAMRAYLEGLSLWRRSRFGEAAVALERAFAADTTFGAAAFMRFRIGNWMLQGAENQVWAQRAQNLRDRMSREERELLANYFGEPGATQSRPRILESRRRTAMLLPESPDAQYLLGDFLWHYGAAAGEPSWLEMARAQFDRALALDSLGPILQHVLQAELLVGDTATIRRAWQAFDRFSDDEFDWSWAWLAAGRTADAALLAALRRQPGARGQPLMSPRAGLFGLSAALTDEMYDLTLRHGSTAARDVATQNYLVSAIVQGRPAAAARAAATDSARRDVLLVLAALFTDGDMAAGAEAAARLASLAPADNARRAEVLCALGIWQARRGIRTAGLVETLAVLGHWRCAAAVALEHAARTGAANLDARLAALDSATGAVIPSFGGFEHLVLARHYEARGDTVRALEAVRRRSTFQGLEWTAATCARMEGRLAAAVGDTASAIRAYRHYLLMRADAEPALVPQRDSVRTELARLERRR
jgi:TolB-like protein